MMSVSRPAKWRAWAVRTSWRRHWRRVAPRRTGGSSPASKTGSAPTTGQRRAATCAPTRRADRGRRSRRSHRIRYRARALEVESTGEHRTPLQQRLLPRRRAGHRTTPPRGAASGGVPARAGSRPAAGTADRDDHAPRWRSSTPSARPPTRSPAGIPSRRRQISTTAPASSAWPSRSAGPRSGRVRRTD